MKEEADLLLSFANLCDAGSISAAARQLGVAKSTLSQRLQQLEQHYGVKLVQRSSRHFQLTPAGRQLYQQAQQLQGLLQQSRQLISEFSEEIKGRVRLAAPQVSGGVLLPRLIAGFSQQHPGVEFELILTDRRQDLIAEQIDLALRVGPLDDSPDLIARPLTPAGQGIRLQMVAAPALNLPLLSHPQELHATQLLHYHPYPQWHLQHPQQGQFTLQVAGQARISSSSQLALYHLCLLAQGVALMPEYMVAEDLKQGRLLALLPAWRGEDKAYHWVYPSRLSPSRAVRLFTDYCWQRLQQHSLTQLLSSHSLM
ncbi:LysR family transcriptional regulator [Balneatrix alpica]|uniref:LysR family transcriptional regulator n=1 Tax=Balneatrix alpica TaxID=75684 RepID=A0ABV5ZAG2_9GAMM|nr:LysR family transcriptional regulator [Balneatrix alpica]